MIGRICCRTGLKDPSNTRSALHTSRESGPRAALPLRRDLADLVYKDILLKVGDKRATYYILKKPEMEAQSIKSE